jgi:hypothetical protein
MALVWTTDLQCGLQVEFAHIRVVGLGFRVYDRVVVLSWAVVADVSPYELFVGC